MIIIKKYTNTLLYYKHISKFYIIYRDKKKVGILIIYNFTLKISISN